MTDQTSSCTYEVLSARDGKIFSVSLPTDANGGDTFTVDGALAGLKLGTVQGVLPQRNNAACASATYSTTTITLSGKTYTGATDQKIAVLVWGYD